MSGYLCRAHGCLHFVQRTEILCASHWALVPTEMQRAVMATEHPARFPHKPISLAWRLASMDALAHVAMLEGYESVVKYLREQAASLRSRDREAER